MKPQPTILGAVIGAAVLQAVVWVAGVQGWITAEKVAVLLVAVTWIAVFVLAIVAARGMDTLRTELRRREDQHEATLTEVEQIGALNEMLLTAGKSKDVGLAFQALARRVGRLIPCDRLALALLKHDADEGQQVQVYTSRVTEPERRRRPRAEQEFALERSIFGQVIRTCEPVLVEDLPALSSDFQDASSLASRGFQSALVLPLISRNRAIGALTVISRQKAAFTPSHRDVMQPLAEILAFAHVAELQYLALDRFKTMEAMAETTIALAADINSALQAIAGQCEILGHQQPALAADIDIIVRQADRISGLLDRMRAAANERLREVAASTGAGIPDSPEAFASDEAFD